VHAHSFRPRQATAADSHHYLGLEIPKGPTRTSWGLNRVSAMAANTATRIGQSASLRRSGAVSAPDLSVISVASTTVCISTRQSRSARPHIRPGTARFGTDPALSALDPLCKARDLTTCMWCIEASSPALMPSIHHWLPWPTPAPSWGTRRIRSPRRRRLR
jgi:hypothetical protein